MLEIADRALHSAWSQNPDMLIYALVGTDDATMNPKFKNKLFGGMGILPQVHIVKVDGAQHLTSDQFMNPVRTHAIKQVTDYLASQPYPGQTYYNPAP